MSTFIEMLLKYEKAISIKGTNNVINVMPWLVSYYNLTAILALYLGFVLYIGPYMMRNRAPFDVRKPMLVYNILQVVVNLIVVFIEPYVVWAGKRDIWCLMPVTDKGLPQQMEMILTGLFCVSRWLDLCDTVFIVLRKNYRQVTFLHIYHHVVVVLVVFLHTRTIGAGGHNFFYVWINGIVHTVMYAYYYATAKYPEIKKNLKVKKNITRMQIVQFIMILIHCAYPLTYRPDCEYPKFWMYAAGLQAIIFIILFTKFYVKTYIRKPVAKQE